MAIPNDLFVFVSTKGDKHYWNGWDQRLNEPITTKDIKKAARFSAAKAWEEKVKYHAEMTFYEAEPFPKDVIHDFDDEQTWTDVEPEQMKLTTATTRFHQGEQHGKN